MKVSEFDNINHLLETLVLKLQTILKDNCIGVYLYGSLVWGDFNYDSSDVDILVIMQNDISSNDFYKLNEMHNQIIQKFPFWNDRLEIAYIAKDTLQNIKSKAGKVAIISPGESFNIKDAGLDWLINCYLLQNISKILFGPKPESIIEPITKEEFLRSVKQQALEWRDWISNTKDSVAYQYYATLTMCRAFYVLKNGEQTSKIVAAKWVAKHYPKWEGLINQAMAKEEVESAYAQVCSFVNEMVDLIESKTLEPTIPAIKQQLDECLDLLTKILGADLLGVYLYGSYLVGGLQKYSDIDLLVITNRATTLDEKRELVIHLLKISGIYMKGTKPPIEMTIVEKAAINPWHYPPHFDFQYGEWLRQSFEMEDFAVMVTHEMPDLALIVTQVLLKSHTLLGSKPEQLLAPVPYSDFIKAMLDDQARLLSDLGFDTRNVLLTLARIWSTLETSEIRSKSDAADWVTNRLPEVYQPVMKRAKSIAIGLEDEYWDDIKMLVKPCADFMLSRTNEQKLLIDLKDQCKLIKLALDRKIL